MIIVNPTFLEEINISAKYFEYSHWLCWVALVGAVAFCGYFRSEGFGFKLDISLIAATEATRKSRLEDFFLKQNYSTQQNCSL